jgi:hypothetical protein
MQTQLLVRALSAIPTSPTIISLEVFQSKSGISGKTVARQVLYFLGKFGIGSFASGGVRFSNTDRLKAALVAIEMGCDIELISKRIDWRDFECLTAHILDSLGYHIKSNLRLVKPRIELDVVGIKANFAIMVDCKHWNYNNASALSRFAKKQENRTKILLNKDERLHRALPVLVTLHSSNVHYCDGVPIVPISKFKLFVIDLDGYEDTVRLVNRQNNRSVVH